MHTASRFKLTKHSENGFLMTFFQDLNDKNNEQTLKPCFQVMPAEICMLNRWTDKNKTHLDLFQIWGSENF